MGALQFNKDERLYREMVQHSLSSSLTSSLAYRQARVGKKLVRVRMGSCLHSLRRSLMVSGSGLGSALAHSGMHTHCRVEELSAYCVLVAPKTTRLTH